MDRFANNGTWEWNNSIPLISSIFCIFSRPSCCYFCQLYSQTWKRYVDRILIKDSRGKAVDPTTKVWRNNIRKNCKESQKGKGGNQRSSIGTSVSSVIIIIIIKSEYIIYIIYSYIAIYCSKWFVQLPRRKASMVLKLVERKSTQRRFSLSIAKYFLL